MNKRGGFLVLVLSFFSILAIAHTVAHFYFWGINIQGVSIGGRAIDGDTNGENDQQDFLIGASLSQLLVVLEWTSVFIFLFVFYTTNKATLRRDIEDLKKVKGELNISGTDIDRLYVILKNKRRLNFEAIKSAFNVDIKVVESWANTLKSGNLADVEYPRVGGQELVLR